MTDRSIVYTGATPRSYDFLIAQNDFQYGLGNLIAAAIGTGTFVDGLGCTVGAGLSVNIGAGSIGQSSTMDSGGVALGSLPLDTNTLMKLGINQTATNIVLTAPATAGFAINYLIEAQLQEADDTPVVLPYYNSANPAQPYTGPGGNGTSQNTRRKQIVALQLKAGGGATIGTQSTPGADAGWVPLWVVTVPNGATVVSAGNIYLAAGAPFIGTKVAQSRTKLSGNLTLYVTAMGNDTTNNGLSTNVAFLTLQAAVNALYNNYDLNGYSATINVGAGTFALATLSGTPTGFGVNSVVTINGAGSSTILQSTGSAGCVNAINGAVVTVNNVAMNGTNGLQSGVGSTLTMGSNCYFGTLTGAQMYAAGLIYVAGNYTINGSAAEHMLTAAGGQIQAINGAHVATLSGTPAFSVATAYANTGQILLAGASGSLTFSGSATGQRYLANYGGLIFTNGGGASYIPGSTAGRGDHGLLRMSQTLSNTTVLSPQQLALQLAGNDAFMATLSAALGVGFTTQILQTLPMQSSGVPANGFWIAADGNVQLAPIADMTMQTDLNLGASLAALGLA